MHGSGHGRAPLYTVYTQYGSGYVSIEPARARAASLYAFSYIAQSGACFPVKIAPTVGAAACHPHGAASHLADRPCGSRCCRVSVPMPAE